MQLEVSDRANASIADILVFVAQNNNADLAARLEVAIEEKLERIALWPYSCPQIWTRSYGKVHKAIVNHLTILFYVVDDVITVVDAVDARSNWQ